MSTRMRKGPKSEPWGMPILTKDPKDISPIRLLFTACLLNRKEQEQQFFRIGLIYRSVFVVNVIKGFVRNSSRDFCQEMFVKWFVECVVRSYTTMPRSISHFNSVTIDYEEWKLKQPYHCIKFSNDKSNVLLKLWLTLASQLAVMV